MQVVRFPSFVQERRKVRLRYGLGTAGTGVGLVVGSSLVPSVQLYIMLGGLILLPSSLWFFSRALDAWLGDQGENRLEKTLEALGEGYILIRNWVPPSTKPTGDIDFLLLGSFGVLVIEAKTYSRPTKCVGDKWCVQLSNGRWRRIASPSRQLARNRDLVSKLSRMKAQGVLVFNNKAQLQLVQPSERVLKWSEVTAFVQSLPDHGQDPNLLWARLSQKGFQEGGPI